MKASLLISFLIVCHYWFCFSFINKQADTGLNKSLVSFYSSNASGNKEEPAPGAVFPADTTTVDVLFATNEDCILYVSQEFTGTVLKSTHKYVRLAPGTYIYKAKSQKTLDELKDSFVVTANGFNEVFIDMLWLVDKKQKEREKAQNKLPGKGSAADIEEVQAALVDNILSNMIFIEGGNFIMGNNKAPTSDEAEHPVTINNVFVSRYEVTQEEWLQVMGYNSSVNQGCASCPVENVSWEEVMKFIRKLNIMSGKKFRLPTEAEWEYVAKLGGKTELDEAGGPEEYIKKTAWYFANSDKKTHPVGEKQPAFSGVYDLYGNVSEWCIDWYHADYYKDVDNVLNPEGPPLGKEKVVRGGSFNEYVGDHFRPSFRYKLKPTEKASDIGFRLVTEAQ